MSKFKYLLPIIAALFLITLCGCWDRHELNTVGIVNAIGIDLDNKGQTKVFLEVKKHNVATLQKTSQGPSIQYFTATGKNLDEALSNVYLISGSSKMLWSLVRVTVFGEDYVKKEGIYQWLELFQRRIDAITDGYIIISKDLKSSDILQIGNNLQNIPSQYIGLLTKDSRDSTSKSIAVDAAEFLRNYYNDGIEASTSIIHEQEQEQILTQKKEESLNISAEGMAIFSGDKLAGFFNGMETMCYNILLSKVKAGTISIPENENSFTSIELHSAKSKYEIKISGNKITVNIKIRLSCRINEQIGNVDLSEPSVIKKTEDLISSVVSRQIDNTIKKAQHEYKSDVFGFGQYIARNNPSAWKILKDNWNNTFSQLDITNEVDINISDTGFIDMPASLKK